MKLSVTPSGPLLGEVTVPGDKSISHRAVILGAVAEGKTHIKGFLEGADCLDTVTCLQKLGIKIAREDPGCLTVEGNGLKGLCEPADVLDVGNSGTTIRLLTGLLASQGFFSVLTGDASIRRRPMDRVIKPLLLMGANIDGRSGRSLAPLSIRGGGLKPIDYTSPVASAQVKSAILLAALGSEGVTRIKEPLRSRDHTERMLTAFGGSVNVEQETVCLTGGKPLYGQEMTIPGDISSAAFLLVAGSIIPGSQILIKNVGINPTRKGVLVALEAMGAAIEITNYREQAGEPVADLLVKSASLRGIHFDPRWIPSLIDEIPILSVAAAFATGTTKITNAAELRVKETDRLAVMAKELLRFGVKVEELADGMTIKGGAKPRGTIAASHGDHRIAMALAILGLGAIGNTLITDAAVVDISFPHFEQILQTIAKPIQ